MKGRFVVNRWKYCQLADKFYDPINNFTWLLYLGGNKNEAIDLFAKQLRIVGPKSKSMGRLPVGAFFYELDTPRTGCFWFPTPKMPVGVLAHEALHGTYYFVDHMKLSPSAESEEALCYYTGYLVEQIDRICRRLTHKNITK